jgi:hypothetical protein
MIVVAGAEDAPPGGTAPARAGGNETKQTPKRHLLVMEDDYFIGLLREEWLLAAGYEVVGVGCRRDRAVSQAWNTLAVCLRAFRRCREGEGCRSATIGLDCETVYGGAFVQSSCRGPPPARSRATTLVADPLDEAPVDQWPAHGRHPGTAAGQRRSMRPHAGMRRWLPKQPLT